MLSLDLIINDFLYFIKHHVKNSHKTETEIHKNYQCASDQCGPPSDQCGTSPFFHHKSLFEQGLIYQACASTVKAFQYFTLQAPELCLSISFSRETKQKVSSNVNQRLKALYHISITYWTYRHPLYFIKIIDREYLSLEKLLYVPKSSEISEKF